MRFLWFTGGVAVGLSLISIAKGSVPENVTSDKALFDRLSEIRVQREADLNIDHGIAKLAALEARYNDERLPGLKKKRVQAPMERILNDKRSLKASRR